MGAEPPARSVGRAGQGVKGQSPLKLKAFCFFFRSANEARLYRATAMLSAVYAVVVCLCVCLSHSGIVSKRLNVESRK